MIATEASSLTAISRLQSEFPSAATLLVYVTLERCLKLFLLGERRSLTNADVDLGRRVGRGTQVVTLEETRHLDDPTFLRVFLTKCTLGCLELIFRVPHHEYSRQRNEVFHSGLYLQYQLGQGYDSRRARNVEYLGIAKRHLVEASTLYFRRPIVDDAGVLRFES
jgi:hypothetical protein